MSKHNKALVRMLTTLRFVRTVKLVRFAPVKLAKFQHNMKGFR